MREFLKFPEQKTKITKVALTRACLLPAKRYLALRGRLSLKSDQFEIVGKWMTAQAWFSQRRIGIGPHARACASGAGLDSIYFFAWQRHPDRYDRAAVAPGFGAIKSADSYSITCQF